MKLNGAVKGEDYFLMWTKVECPHYTVMDACLTPDIAAIELNDYI
jgi:hypothetical protein